MDKTLKQNWCIALVCEVISRFVPCDCEGHARLPICFGARIACRRREMLKSGHVLYPLMIVFSHMLFCGCETYVVADEENHITSQDAGCYHQEYTFGKIDFPMGIHVEYQDDYGWWRVVHQFSDEGGYFEFSSPTSFRIKCIDRTVSEFIGELRQQFQRRHPHSLVIPRFFDGAPCPLCLHLSEAAAVTKAPQNENRNF